jgi:sugar/nucleoside kinase (ribokinase family)
MYGWEPRAEVVADRLFSDFPMEVVALTLGAEGCELRTRNETVRGLPGPVKCIDAVGAGDAFSAMLAMGLLEGRPLQEIADHCNRIGAFVASQQGAMPRLPVGFFS